MGQEIPGYPIAMPHDAMGLRTPIRARGIVASLYDAGATWRVHITPVPLTPGEALKPAFDVVFDVPEVADMAVPTLADVIMSLANTLARIAEEEMEPVVCIVRR